MRRGLWSVVLAAGSGRRLASITGGVPKQFWSASGGPTLLEDTLARTTALAAPDRTVIVVDRTHASFVRALPLRRFDQIAYQPHDRGTAAGVLLGLIAVAAVAPDATVLLTPSDHGFTRPEVFASGIRRAADVVGAHPREVVLFGVRPVSAEGDYGWITPATAASDTRLRPVSAFAEKPLPLLARRLFESGAVWNTMVLVARVRTLMALYREHLPVVACIFDQALDLRGPDRAAYLDTRYDELPVADFSRDVLGVASGLSVHTWPAAVGWSDLGTPDRLERWRVAAS